MSAPTFEPRHLADVVDDVYREHQRLAGLADLYLIDAVTTDCPDCGGFGEVATHQPDDYQRVRLVACEACSGTGEHTDRGETR